MKNLRGILFALVLSTAALQGETKFGFVNFKAVVEQSKSGKQEQATFEALKKQMEDVLGEKEKTLTEIGNKLNDPDQLDVMSPEAETDLKRKFRALSQEMQGQQQQFYQTLNQANFKVVQKLTELVTKASEAVAKDEKLDVVMNDDGCFFYNKGLNVSDKVVKKMDELADQVAKNEKK